MNENLSKLPDYPALLQLGRALWRNETARGAALLVGAGFSKNADRPGLDTKSPPLWADLLREMAVQLYPSPDERAPSDPLRVAEEYRTYFGQAALDDFIRANFPDKAWLPGPLHLELLKLPWSDVLTTNWDTLLERAAETIDPVYDLVALEADLPHARSPRIVKLHGSIGDAGPLIFAEEDYRTYPLKHAAYVNLARQIFIENELCLVGFSGDDPNFLQWAGWVRDQLGGKARRIYLVGHLRLSPAKRKFLESHNISPIDFAPIIDDQSPDRHARATQLFLSALSSAQPRASHEWKTVAVGDYPLQQGGSDAFQRARSDPEFAMTALVATIDIWKSDRAGYPGWLVCPAGKRRLLGYGMEEAWLMQQEVLARLSIPVRAQLFFELVWRRTTACLMLTQKSVNDLSTMLDAHWADISPEQRSQMLVALMRDARVAYNFQQFKKWEQLVLDDGEADDTTRMEAQYQKALFARDQADFRTLFECADSMHTNDPIWLMRRAALYAEAGHHVRAAGLIKDATDDLAKRHRLDRSSLWVKARLGWAEWLSRGVDSADWSRRRELPPLREFKDLQIDPWGEIEGISDAAGDIEAERRTQKGAGLALFEPGHYRPSSDTARGTVDSSSLAVLYEFDQVMETVGLPIRINNVGICTQATLRAVEICFQPTVQWYVWLLRALHSPFDKAFERHFGRLAIAELQPEVSSALIALVEASTTYWIGRLDESKAPGFRDDHAHAGDQLRLYLHVLARLTVRMAEEEAIRIFLHALDLAQRPDMRHHWLQDALKELTKYSAAAISRTAQGRLAGAVMDFPLSAEIDAEPRFWLSAVEFIWNSTPNTQEQGGHWHHRVGKLIDAAHKEQPSRKEAILRLTYLSLRDALGPDERSAFAEALWSITDERQDALPYDTNLLDSTISELPAPQGVDAKERVRNRLFKERGAVIQDAPLKFDSRKAESRHSYVMSLVHAAQLGLRPSSERAACMFDNIVGGSPSVQESANIDTDFPEWTKDHLGRVLADVVIPAMSPLDLTESRAEKLLLRLQSTSSWSGLAGLTYFFDNVPNLKNKVRQLIRKGLIAPDHQRVYSSTSALQRWAEAGLEADTLALADLLERLVSAIEIAPEQGLHLLLDCARTLLEKDMLGEDSALRLLHALADLATRTRYSDIDAASIRAVSISLVRSECVKLAMALATHVDDDGTIVSWIADAKADALPEVRFSVS